MTAHYAMDLPHCHNAQWSRRAIKQLKQHPSPAPEPCGVLIGLNPSAIDDDNRIEPVLKALIEAGIIASRGQVSYAAVYQDATISGCLVTIAEP